MMSNNEIGEGFPSDLGSSAAAPIASSKIGFQVIYCSFVVIVFFCVCVCVY